MGDNDDELFRRAMADVRPLKNRPRSAVRAKPPVRPRQTARAAATDESLRISYNDRQLAAVDDTAGSRVVFARPGLQKRVMRSLKRGEAKVADDLDLHGLYREQAGREIETFIARSLASGHRCVRIIHGKGFRSADRRSVLKPLTLTLLKKIAQVQAFCSCTPKDGGDGAVYVLLKRLR